MICFVNDRFLPYAEASVHVSDIGLQRGFAIFDYFLSIGGSIPFLPDYLDRFYSSAVSIGLKVPFGKDQLQEKIAHILRLNNFGRSGIKLLLSGGYADDLYTPTKPNLLILNVPMPYHPGDFIDGIKLLLLEYLRFSPEIKTTFYFPSISMLPELKKKGALEVLYHHGGVVSETTRANIFLIKNGQLITPHANILKGVTRKYIIEVASSKMNVIQRDVKVGELWDADEIFITGTSKHIAPVIGIDDKIIGSGRPGNLTLSLAADFSSFYQTQMS